eukprot:2951881-Prymnesium_polylepis.1
MLAALRFTSVRPWCVCVFCGPCAQNYPKTASSGKRKVASKAYLVDLAGSERASKTGAEGETLKEVRAPHARLHAPKASRQYSAMSCAGVNRLAA